MKNFTLIIVIMLFSGCKKDSFAQPVKDQSRSGVTKIDTLIIRKFKSKLLNEFYTMNNNETVWQSKKKRKAVIASMMNANKVGLNPKDYNLDKLSEYEKNVKNLPDSTLVTYDILLTKSIQNYMTHISKGKLNPKIIYNDYDLKEKEIDINKVLTTAYDNDTFDEEITKIEPTNLIYKELIKGLKIIDALPEDNTKNITFTEKGKSKKKKIDFDLVDVKKKLMYWNYLPKKDSITNVYDEETIKAVKEFQENQGLVVDGAIGKGSILALNTTKTERKEQIIANIERWRWYPNDFGTHYTIVNIPEYSLNVVKDGDTIQTYKVIVGKKARRSPVLNSKLRTVVFNPTWTVPPTIIKEDLVPDATKDRSYFSKMHITIYDYKRRKISPYDWKPEKANNYDYVQDPGNFNSLGNMKILFSNRFSVYLHDTNHKSGFSSNFRSLSSGCTRVENPLKLAKYVLYDSVTWNDKKINKIIADKKTLNILIKEEILHYQLYFTVRAKKNHLIFRDDVYNLDADLYCRLGY
jgi:L,D-transpeptidase YcbB